MTRLARGDEKLAALLQGRQRVRRDLSVRSRHQLSGAQAAQVRHERR